MKRPAHSTLRPFIESVWVSRQIATPDSMRVRHERALPNGTMSMVLRLSDQPIRLVDQHHPACNDYGYAVVGGMRSNFYVREISGPVYSIGAVLLPGASEMLFGVSAMEFAQRHVRLDDIWGNKLALLRAQLLEARTPAMQLNLFESFIIARLANLRGMHPAVAQALTQFRTTTDIRRLVSQSGYGHRRFIELFNRAVGMTPKLYSRVLRFQKALRLASGDRPVWTDIALNVGYSDQSHLNREFIEFAGITPEEYRKISPASPSHVAIDDQLRAKRR